MTRVSDRVMITKTSSSVVTTELPTGASVTTSYSHLMPSAAILEPVTSGATDSARLLQTLTTSPRLTTVATTILVGETSVTYPLAVILSLCVGVCMCLITLARL